MSAPYLGFREYQWLLFSTAQTRKSISIEFNIFPFLILPSWILIFFLKFCFRKLAINCMSLPLVKDNIWQSSKTTLLFWKVKGLDSGWGDKEHFWIKIILWKCLRTLYYISHNLESFNSLMEKLCWLCLRTNRRVKE